MPPLSRLGIFALAPLLVAACSSKSQLAGSGSVALPAEDTSCAGPCPGTNIKHLIVIVQENHTFDNYFGRYCTAPAGSNPSCTTGPACCEAAPPVEPSGSKPMVLDDTAMSAWDPDHTAACETTEMNGGKMDMYVSAKCGSAENFALAPDSLIQPYWDLARGGALADRYFQPIIGQSSSNDMYLARAQYVFTDNSVSPTGAIGTTCELESTPGQFSDTTIGDLLTAAGVPWTFFAEGYAAMSTAVGKGGCPPKPDDCAFLFPNYPCLFDPSDVPFAYYPSTRDDPATMKDYTALTSALKSGGLPAVSFVKAIGYKTEHPGHGDTLSDGVAWVTDLETRVAESQYRGDTLVLLTYDEGGGYFDHVTPPPTSTVDNKPYGTRVPLIASGPFARKGTVSHATMEHSSIVKFIEWNWLGATTGQLKGRDAVVANLGSLLDPSTTGAAVPEN